MAWLSECIDRSESSLKTSVRAKSTRFQSSVRESLKFLLKNYTHSGGYLLGRQKVLSAQQCQQNDLIDVYFVVFLQSKDSELLRNVIIKKSRKILTNFFILAQSITVWVTEVNSFPRKSNNSFSHIWILSWHSSAKTLKNKFFYKLHIHFLPIFVDVCICMGQDVGDTSATFTNDGRYVYVQVFVDCVQCWNA